MENQTEQVSESTGHTKHSAVARSTNNGLQIRNNADTLCLCDLLVIIYRNQT